MRKLVPLLLVVVALAATGVALSSGGPNEKLASQVRIYGGGVYGPCFGGTTFCFQNGARSFAIDVHVDGGGHGAAYGDWQNGVAGSFVNQGQVTCAAIAGDRMIIGGYITASTASPSLVGLAFAQYYRDNGSVDAATPDEATFAVLDPNDGLPGDFPTSFPATCPAQPFPSDVFPELWAPIAGNVVVQR